MIDFLVDKLQRMKRENRPRCQAMALSSEERCKKPALFGTRYCWQHEGKMYPIIGIVVAVVTAAWNLLVPSAEEKQLRQIHANQSRSAYLKVFTSHEPLKLGLLYEVGQILFVPQPAGVSNETIYFQVQNIGDLVAENSLVYLRLGSNYSYGVSAGWEDLGVSGGDRYFRTKLQDIYKPDYVSAPSITMIRPPQADSYFHVLMFSIRAKNSDPMDIPMQVFMFNAISNVPPFVSTNREAWRTYAAD